MESDTHKASHWFEAEQDTETRGEMQVLCYTKLGRQMKAKHRDMGQGHEG